MDGDRQLTPIDRHLTTAQLAELLAVHPETIRRAAASGALASVRIGRERRYPETAVRDWLSASVDVRRSA
jgi:excisionase family DNA binding protein